MAMRQDRRAFGRRETNVLAWVRIDGRPRLRCYIRNITPKGAFLEFEPPTWLPFRFMVEIESDGTLFGCEIRHARQTGIGILFVPLDAVAEYRAKSHGARTGAAEWLGTGRSASPASSPATQGDADGSALAKRIRAAINTKD